MKLYAIRQFYTKTFHEIRHKEISSLSSFNNKYIANITGVACSHINELGSRLGLLERPETPWRKAKSDRFSNKAKTATLYVQNAIKKYRNNALKNYRKFVSFYQLRKLL